MATVCVCVQDSQKCLVPWTIFQTDDGITLSELLERMKAGRITVIVPSSDLVSSTIEKAFVGKSKESLVSIDHCIHLSDILSTFGQFIRYNSDPVCMDHSWTTVVVIRWKNYTILLDTIPSVTTVHRKRFVKYHKMFTHCAVIAYPRHM